MTGGLPDHQEPVSNAGAASCLSDSFLANLQAGFIERTGNPAQERRKVGLGVARRHDPDSHLAVAERNLPTKSARRHVLPNVNSSRSPALRPGERDVGLQSSEELAGSDQAQASVEGTIHA